VVVRMSVSALMDNCLALAANLIGASARSDSPRQ